MGTYVNVAILSLAARAPGQVSSGASVARGAVETTKTVPMIIILHYDNHHARKASFGGGCDGPKYLDDVWHVGIFCTRDCRLQMRSHVMYVQPSLSVFYGLVRYPWEMVATTMGLKINIPFGTNDDDH